ncbi:Uncharacterised protein [Achromobacter xylosoxidans]|nr:Uncharacterised protein [Achromobacter xylosoxidans]
MRRVVARQITGQDQRRGNAADPGQRHPQVIDRQRIVVGQAIDADSAHQIEQRHDPARFALVSELAQHQAADRGGQAEDQQERDARPQVVTVLAHDLRQPGVQAVDQHHAQEQRSPEAQGGAQVARRENRGHHIAPGGLLARHFARAERLQRGDAQALRHGAGAGLVALGQQVFERLGQQARQHRHQQQRRRAHQDHRAPAPVLQHRHGHRGRAQDAERVAGVHDAVVEAALCGR